jgi:hypothetical protein
MRLPYFPLHSVVFPHLPLPLHIFEERYRAMTRDILADGSPYAGKFVVAMLTNGQEAGDDASVGRSVGTICEVRTAERFDDGRWVLLAAGVARATLGEIDRSGAYATVDATELPELGGTMDPTLLTQVQGALDGYLATVKRFVTTAASMGHADDEVQQVARSLDEVLKPISLPDDPLAASYAVGGVLQIELTRKQELLELPDAASRLRAELTLLRRESRLLADGAMPPLGAGDLGYNPN